MRCRYRSRIRFFASAVSLTSLGCSTPAFAELPTRQRETDAIEVTIAGGYIRAPATYALAAPRSIGEGAGIELGLAIRTPPWSLGIIGGYADLERSRESSLHAAKAGVSFRYQLPTTDTVTPWVGIATGYRLARSAGRSAHGFEVGRVVIGADVRAGPLLSAGPIASIGIDVFPWSEGIAPAHAAWFVSLFAGIQGRFDLSSAVVGD